MNRSPKNDSEMIAGACFLAILALVAIAGWVQIWRWVVGWLK